MGIRLQLSPLACANSCSRASRCCRKGFKMKLVSHQLRWLARIFFPVHGGRGSPSLDTIFSSKFHEILHSCPVDRWTIAVCPKFLPPIFMGQGAVANYRTTKPRSAIWPHEYLSTVQLRNARGQPGGPVVGTRSAGLPIRPPSYTRREDICTSVYRRSG